MQHDPKARALRKCDDSRLVLGTFQPEPIEPQRYRRPLGIIGNLKWRIFTMMSAMVLHCMEEEGSHSCERSQEIHGDSQPSDDDMHIKQAHEPCAKDSVLTMFVSSPLLREVGVSIHFQAHIVHRI